MSAEFPGADWWQEVIEETWEELRVIIDDMIAALKASPRAEGQERIYVAGEPEAECERLRRAEGIPLAPALVAQCQTLADSLGVARLKAD